MNQDEYIRVLEPGRVYFDYGPVSMVVSAYENDNPMTQECKEMFPVIDETLKSMSGQLAILKCRPDMIKPDILTEIPRMMYDAVNATGEETLTPMAAVAGTMADIVADCLFARGATRVIVNNGGDVALRLAEREEARTGLLSDISSGQIDRVLMIRGADNVGGLATSGLGGRSLTRGVASAVTVLSETCRQADALATHIANCSYIESGQVVRVKAGFLDTESDISDLDVTLSVGELSGEEINKALGQIREEAMRQKERGTLTGVIACVQNHFISYPENYFKNKIKERC